ncbi:fimbrial protein [Salmonella enterica]|nr:fimbrial protein [Salmonella enterica]HCM1829070.1 fimbrial protein [Salmonella enterica subsp. salamae serovar 48:z81:z39]EHX3570555.1 fimbrial protein [Salmonella enterica]EIB6271641.1 fimbrial protein [Salmonella enterica]EIC8059839.1 fimbrial protein [Salmonella enterica]
MKRQLLPGAIAGILIASGVAVIPAAQATEQLKLTVDANITDGTCSVAVLEGELPTNTIAFGNVYISEVFAKTQVKPFKLRFSNCAGLVDKKATVTLAPAAGIGCAGGETTNAEFSNASSSTTKAAKTGVEVWTTETPEGADSVQFHCYNKTPQTVDLSGASANTPVDYPLSARMVPVTGAGISQLSAGDFYSPTVFTVTYQ